ncbi:MAG: ABC transporter substrate-binding protein [Firmicutes bacterium]|jgi:peptide/nickel transport system substrate-binding protein|nr:ABC transporter substrate-binding protein [Bacillota bacterium]
MKRVKLFLAVILSVLACFFLLPGCGGEKGDETGTGTIRDELVVIIDNTKIAVLDPHNPAASSSSTAWAFHMIYDTLVKEEDGQFYPDLATSWNTDDWKHFTFQLRDDVYFHNGEKLTADDVVFTVERAKENPGSAGYDKLAIVESARAIDEHTVELVLESVNVEFLWYLSDPRASILNREAVEADPDKGTWIGTGAWTVSEFASNEYVVLEANENYWGEKPKTKKMTLKYVAEESTRLMQLENGEAQVCFSINANDYSYVESQPDKFVTYSFTTNNNSFIAFNMNDPICGDINFRKAVAHAIDREAMVASAFNGYGEVNTLGTFWGYRTEFKNTDIPIIPRDLDKAKEYLAQSKYNGETIEIVSAIPDLIKTAQIVQAQLAEVGIKTTIKETDPPGMSAYASYADNKAQMIVYTASCGLNGGSMKALLYPYGSSNRASYNNEEVARLFDLAVTQPDPKEREATYHRIQEIVAEELPYINLLNTVFLVCCAKGVDGLKLSNLAFHDLTYMYMVE